MNFDFIVNVFLIFCLIASAYTMHKQQKEIKTLRKEIHAFKISDACKMEAAVHTIKKFMLEGLI